MASAWLILLIAKPTWISTQSPGTGGSSCKSPKSTLRRTPTTSTTARFEFRESSSTICPGIARHTLLLLLPPTCFRHPIAFFSFLLSGHQFKIEFDLVLQTQGSPGKGNRLYPIVRLPQPELTGDTQRCSHAGNAGIKDMRPGNAVK